MPQLARSPVAQRLFDNLLAHALTWQKVVRPVAVAVPADGESYTSVTLLTTDEDGTGLVHMAPGFGEDDLSITIEDNQLVVRGRAGEDGRERMFLHRGIAGRHFQRTFVLAEGVEVTGAALENGLLHVDLERAVPDPIVRRIEINKSHS